MVIGARLQGLNRTYWNFFGGASATKQAIQWGKYADGLERQMDIDRMLDEAVERLEADAGEREQARALWSALASGLEAGEEGAAKVWQASLIEEVVVWRIVSLRMMKALGKGPLFGSKENDPGVGKVHPAVDALAKTQERQRKVMKELMERLDAATGGEAQSLSEMMMPILKKSEGVLEHALRPRRSAKKTRGRGAKPRPDRDVAAGS